MSNANREGFVANVAENQIRRWEKQREYASNSTVPPFGDDYETLQLYLIRKCNPRTHITPEKPDKVHLGRKSGAEAGWLPDDDLTQRWLQYVKEYRAACNAAEREEPPNNEEAKGGAS